MARAVALIAGLAAFASCGRSEANPPPDLPAIGGRVSVLRIPRDGGAVEAYLADSLAEPIWEGRGRISPVREVLGVNLDARLLLAIDKDRNLIGLDLETRGQRQLAADVRSSVFVPSGSVFAVSAKHRVTRYDLLTPTPYREALPGPTRFRTGTQNDRFVAVTDAKPAGFVVYSAERRIHESPVAAREIAATYWGDLVAAANDREITLLDTDEPFRVRTINAGRPVQHIAFSPSGHRLYAALDDNRIAAFDRYSLERVGTIAVNTSPSAIRTDGTGRWMLARSTKGDSTWVIDLATTRSVVAIRTRWESDLPTVAGAATLLARLDGDLVALDLSKPSTPEIGRVPGGAEDLWLVSAWLPRDRARVAAAAAESVQVAQDSLLLTDSATVTTTADEFFLQVSRSQNPDWSRVLARDLTAAGYPARVLDPASPDDGYRVVVGPYATREAAEEVGRKLGRPYFILTNPTLQNR